MSFTCKKIFLLALALLCICECTVYAQEEAPYYRLQYQKLKWRVFRTKQFSIYYPANAADSLYRFVASEMPQAAEAIRKATLKEVPNSLNIVIYPSVTRSYESNIGMYETLKFPLPSFVNKGKRVIVAFNGSYTDLRSALYESLARAMWESQVRNADKEPANKGKNKHDGDIPYWFSEGAIRYFGHGWRIEDEDQLRRSFAAQHFNNWQDVTAWQPRLAGQAFCYYMSQKYYPKAVAQTVFQLKKKKALARAIRLIAKRDLDTITSQCMAYYRQRFNNGAASLPAPTLTLPHGPGIVQQVLVNDAKDQVAYTLLYKGRRTVYCYHVKEHYTTRLAVYKLPPWIDDHSKDPYPLLKWHKSSQQLYIAMPVKGKVRIKRYHANGEWEETNILEGIDGISSLMPLSDREYLLAAYREGQSDIIAYNDNSGKVTAFTDDEYDDQLPIKDGATGDIYWISRRPEKYTERRIYLIGVGYKKDTLWQGLYHKTGNTIETVLADTIGYVHYDKPVKLQDGRILLTTTRQGIERFILLDPASRHMEELGDYKPVQYLAASDEMAAVSTTADSLGISFTPLDQWITGNRQQRDSATWMTDYLKMRLAQHKEDSILSKARDTTHYAMDDIFKPRPDIDDKQKGKKKGKKKPYRKEETEPYILQLHSAYFTAQVNNDYFINRYQPYKAYQGQFKFPELGGMTKGGFTDLLENHHFNIAYRLPAATEGSDISISYENTELKTDWGLSWFRKVETLKPDPNNNWTDENGRPYPKNAKTKTHYYEFFVRRPLTYYSAVSLQIAFRDDRTIFLATDKYTLDFPNLAEAWSINTLSYKINKLEPTLPGLFKGFKAGVFADGLRTFDKSEASLVGITTNVHWHKPVYKYITVVGQLHMGYSAGDARILYNLGGADKNVTPQVDTSVHFAQAAPYAFQTLVTPFRGWAQNGLYGNAYALINLDVYFPLFRTLIPIETPLPFINNMQPGILCDVATAKETWRVNAAGKTSWSYGLSLKSTLAGYPLRIDYAWPGSFSKKPVWYFSLSL